MRSNPALSLAPFSRWTQSDKAPQRRFDLSCEREQLSLRYRVVALNLNDRLADFGCLL